MMGLGIIGIGAIAYYLYKKNKEKKGAMASTPSKKSFAGDDEGFFNLAAKPIKKPSPKWVAGGYVVNNEHPRGATWMALSTDGSLGYWADGYVPRGTVSSTFGQSNF